MSSVNIKITGQVRIELIDANTGEILDVDDGENLVLNTGLQSLCHMVAGDVVMPVGQFSDQYLNTVSPLKYFPFYLQFGQGSSPVSSTDKSVFDNGSLDMNTVTPTTASDIIKVVPSFPKINSVTLQGTLLNTQGNGIGQPMTYREVVLMSKISNTPATYSWFARRVFADKVKTNQNILNAMWTFTFTTKEGLT